MSADDFQTKYASVMESMLKSAVAETTKLFETMVDDLKAEISRIKKENEDLKTRCSQFENGKSQTTAEESEPPTRLSDRSEKRDTAVQCDLFSFRTMLVEQCQPLRNSSLQNQPQQSYEEKEYGLQEHNYEIHGDGNPHMAFIFVKQEVYHRLLPVELKMKGRPLIRNIQLEECLKNMKQPLSYPVWQ
ncbi:hypothetical protein INR49_022990 [Caranx melampygus]|nr:hypothetical protein INR49_022990 [Caranx melampygus]